MKKLWLIPIIILAFFVRLYKIDNPIADWHSFRQADTAAVSLQFYKNGIDLLHPTYLDISNIQSGLDNPKGYRMVEFPLFNALHASVAHLVPFEYFDQVGRLLSVVLSLLSIVFLYLLVQRLIDHPTALLTSLIMALAPFNVYYSRTVLPESLGILLFLLGTYLFVLYQAKSSYLLFFSAATSLALAILVRPYVVFFLLPIYILILVRRQSLFPKLFTFLGFSLFVVTPFLLWREWITQFPEGIPASSWLFDLPNPIRFHPAWWRWLFAERLSKLILGYFGVIPLVLGILTRPPRVSTWFFHFWFLGVLIYFSVFAGGNVTHDYYQAIIFPSLAVLMAIGLKTLLTPNHFIWPISFFTGILVFAFFIAFSFYEVKGYYQINHYSIILAGQKADKILPQDAKVLAPYFGDTALLYQTRRQGWPHMTYDLTRMLSLGATHFVSVNYDDTTNQVIADKRFEVLEKNSDYVIVDLLP